MRRLLQNENHADTRYDRPNLPWVCGRAEEGCPCTQGPTAGGKCPESPACKPRRSLRRRRGRLVIGLAIFTVGALLMTMGAPRRREVFAPGPLSQAHARLVAGHENRCAACHPGGLEAALRLASLEENATSPLPSTQSALCMECHRKEFEAEHALAAHGLPPARLQGDAALAGLAGSSNPIACATCHQEHHGANHDLQAMADARCQSCHQQKYRSFASDHPDFGLWPYRRRTRINFDHNAHAAKHYQGKPFACSTCHIDGPHGDVKLLAGYERSCASCHDEDIRTTTARGLAILALPTLDRLAMSDAGQPLGSWPEEATGDYDGDLSPIAKLLLAADSAAAAAMNRLGADFSFYDLDPDSPDDARDAAVLAEAIRELVGGLSSRGHVEIGARVGRLGVSSEAMSPDLSGALPIELIDDAREAWFGARGGQGDAPSKQLSDRQGDGGWFVDDQAYALRYVPQGHADPLLRAWIDLATSLGPDKLPLRDAVLAELMGRNSAGRCATCHSIDQHEADQLLVNWKGLDASSRPRGFTRFSHRPHLTQPMLQDCTHCHSADPLAAAQVAPYASRRPDDFVGQFLPLSKAACIACHQPQAAGQACTQCHNYHVDVTAAQPLRTSSGTPPERH